MAFRFRPLEREDFPAVSSWLAPPHVAEWWRDPADMAAVRDRYEPRVSGLEPTEVFVVEHAGVPIGLIQRYRMEDYPEWGRNAEWEAAVSSGTVARSSAGIDYLIGDDRYIGRGIGAGMIAAFVELVWDRYPDLTGIVVEVEETNRRSWRALEKAGFERAWAGVPNSEAPEDGRPNTGARTTCTSGFANLELTHAPRPRTPGGGAHRTFGQTASRSSGCPVRFGSRSFVAAETRSPAPNVHPR